MNPSWCWLLWSPYPPPPRFYGYQETLIQSMVPKSHSQPPFGMHNTPVNNGRYLPNINWWVSESRISNGWTIQQYEFAALSKTWSRPSATILRLRPRDKVMHCRWWRCHWHSQGLQVGLRQLRHTLKPWRCDDTPEVEARCDTVGWFNQKSGIHSPVDYGEDPMVGRGRNTFQVVMNGISEPATVGDGNGESRFSRLICTTVAMIVLSKVNIFTELVSKIDHQSFVEMQLKMDWETITRKIREVWTMIEAFPPSIFWSLKDTRHWPEHHKNRTLSFFNHRLVVDSSVIFK